MPVGPGFTNRFLCGIAPGHGSQQAIIFTATFLVRKEFAVGFAEVADSDIPAVSTLRLLVDPGDVFMFGLFVSHGEL